MEVQVHDGNIEDGIRRLKKMIGIDGILVSLKFRDLYPNLTDRARAKKLRSMARKKRGEKRREARRG